MKFHIGDLVTRPADVHDHDYDNKRSVRIKDVDGAARVGPHTLIGIVVYTHRDYTCMKGMEGQEHTHQEAYDVVWRNWINPSTLEWRPGHLQKGFLEHGLQLIESRTYSVPEIVYVAKNMQTEILKRKLSGNPMLIVQADQISMQLNVLGWVVKKMPIYLMQFQKGGKLDNRGSGLQDGNKPATL